jgi:hypothetical protein
MRRIQFTEDEVRQLNKGRILHKHPILRRRMTALYIKAMGRRHKAYIPHPGGELKGNFLAPSPILVSPPWVRR